MSELRVRHFGEGPLSKGSAFIYTLMAVEFLLLVALLPGLIPYLLLARDASNLPLFALCALPAGPALSAAVYALRQRRLDLTDLKPATAFWRGYRANFWSALQIWAPLLVWLTIIAVNLSYLTSAGVPAWWAALLVVIAFGATLWGINALVITSLFSFRARDVARLAVYYLGRTKTVTLGNVCVLIVAGGLAVLASEVILGLLGSVLALMLLQTCQPMIADIQKEFVA
jgi:uncharacterized membrane protein YesL